MRSAVCKTQRSGCGEKASWHKSRAWSLSWMPTASQWASRVLYVAPINKTDARKTGSTVSGLKVGWWISGYVTLKRVKNKSQYPCRAGNVRRDDSKLSGWPSITMGDIWSTSDNIPWRDISETRGKRGDWVWPRKEVPHIHSISRIPDDASGAGVRCEDSPVCIIEATSRRADGPS